MQLISNSALALLNAERGLGVLEINGKNNVFSMFRPDISGFNLSNKFNINPGTVPGILWKNKHSDILAKQRNKKTQKNIQLKTD